MTCIVCVLFCVWLQVVEMYSSGGDLHLELPTGQQGGTGKLWVSSCLCVCWGACVRPHLWGIAHWFEDEHHPRCRLPPGDSPLWDEGGDESQLLVQRCRQPHCFHQDQNQCPQWRPVHHPPCRGGGHIRFASKPCEDVYSRHLCPFHAVNKMSALLCSPWYILLHRDAWLWYASITRWEFPKKDVILSFFFSLLIFAYFSIYPFFQIVPSCWISIF